MIFVSEAQFFEGTTRVHGKRRAFFVTQHAPNCLDSIGTRVKLNVRQKIDKIDQKRC